MYKYRTLLFALNTRVRVSILDYLIKASKIHRCQQQSEGSTCPQEWKPPPVQDII